MSLILEALRKSEEEHQTQETPTLRPAFNKTSPPQAKPLTNRRNIMSIFVILNGLLILGILYRSSLFPSYYPQHGVDDKNQVNQNQLINTNISHILSDVDDNSLESGLSTKKLPEKHHASTSPPVTNTTLSLPQIKLNAADGIVQPVAQPHAKERISPQREKPEKRQNITPQVATTSSKLQLLDTPNVNEISPQIQQQLPKLRYESHWYDKQPDKRTVIINSHNLKEGVRLSHNLMVHSITKDGCILIYKGLPFHMLMLQSWPEIDQATY